MDRQIPPRVRWLRIVVSATLVAAVGALLLVVLPAAQNLLLGAQLTSASNFGVNGSVTNLTPGVGAPMTLKFSNPYTNAADSITVKSVTVTVSPTTTVPNAPPNCSAGSLSLVYEGGAPIQFTGSPPSATVTFVSGNQPYIPAQSTANNSDVSVLLDSHASNTGCQSVTFPFNFSAAGTYMDGTSTVVTSSANPASIDQLVTYTATVTPSMSGESPSPTGSVIFYDGSTPISCNSSTAFSFNSGTNSGTATCTTSYGSVGSHSISAKYSGDSNFVTSTSPTTTEVVVASACVTLPTSGSNVTTIASTYGGNFEVTAGKVLYLNKGTITGNVQVDSGGAFVTAGGSVNGNVMSSGGPVDIHGTAIGGNVQTTDAQTSLSQDTSVHGNVNASGTSVFCSVGVTGHNVTIGGNLILQSLISGSTTEYVCSTAVTGNFTYQYNNAPSVLGGTSSAGCGGLTNSAGNSTGGVFQVQYNTAPVTVAGNQVAVTSQTAVNLLVQYNSALLTVNSNTVGGNMVVQYNSLPAGSPASTLTNNTAGRGCQLGGDTPGILGSGNTASGQDTCNATA